VIGCIINVSEVINIVQSFDFILNNDTVANAKQIVCLKKPKLEYYIKNTGINGNNLVTFQSHDTSPQIRKIIIAGYRRMTSQQKLKRVTELTQAVQQLALARIRKQYGECSEREQQLRLASLWLDRDTMIRVFDWDPEVKGY